MMANPFSNADPAAGTLLFGSTSKGVIYRAAPGAKLAQSWIRPGAENGLLTAFGVRRHASPAESLPVYAINGSRKASSDGGLTCLALDEQVDSTTRFLD